MERSHIDVRFAYEYGDKSLPKIKELVCCYLTSRIRIFDTQNTKSE